MTDNQTPNQKDPWDSGTPPPQKKNKKNKEDYCDTYLKFNGKPTKMFNQEYTFVCIGF